MNRFLLKILFIVPIFLIAGNSHGQLEDLLKKIPKKIPGSDDILKRGPAITTSAEDAVYCVPFLDDFNPKQLKSINSLERTSEGYHIFVPGLYQFDVQSFCLKAATFAPSGGPKGDGYLFAPTKGPRADIVKNIIRRSFDHPEIKQGAIQLLLWAIISYTKLSDMPPERQLTASTLLTPKEMLEINDGALGLTREDLLDKALDNLPSEVSQVLRAEAKIRKMLTRANSTYQEIERVAVLTGNPPRVEEDNLPYARWSLRPEGFFIRYFPHGYTKTRVEIYLPEIFQIEFDELGRITLIADEVGNSIETTYDESIEPIKVDVERSLEAFAFRSIHFGRPGTDGREERLKAEWKESGWTFVGIPTQWGLNKSQGGDRFSGLEERFEWAKEHQLELVELDNQFNPQGDRDVVGVIMNLGHYSVALDAVLEARETGNVVWADEHLELVKKAWQFAVWLREMYTAEEGASGYEYFGNDAVHRDMTSRKQRLAMRLFIHRMNWHNLPGFRHYYDYLRRHPRGLLKPMCLAGIVQ